MPRAGVGLMDILNFAHILQEYLGGGVLFVGSYQMY